ncbi:MAG: Gfo/Idh/MocA family oxidoreductase [Terracidiphilus sp.]|nr:Gfo/Idh/MocA family oxidoreductase [Terracidiphilus sp.]
MKRREFLGTAGTMAAGVMVMKAGTALGYAANSAVQMGLLGCGGRGTHVATSFSQNTVAQVVALADMFPDQLAKGKAHFDEVNAKLNRAAIDEKMLFKGPSAYEQLAASGVEMIQISTPSFFHVGHLAAAVAAGKHVYCEKPMGVDVRQTREALKIAKKVGAKQSVDVGFQCRNAPPLAAAIKKIRAGALGEVASLTGYYYAPAAKEKGVGTKGDEHRLRNWIWDRALSGDILVEQNIHIIDLCNWVAGSHPVKAVATGGRRLLKHEGDNWDNYQVEFTYPGDVRFSFASKQFGDYSLFDAGFRVFGEKGAASIAYAGEVKIEGAVNWIWEDESQKAANGSFAANGAFGDNLKYADREKEKTFIASIVDGPAHNQIEAGMEAAMTAMLGRMAGLRGHEVSWDELLQHGETYELGMDLKQFA